MTRFRLGQRIRLINAEPKGMTGTVCRLRYADDGAWAKMDQDLPPDLRSFPDPKDERFRNRLVYPDECESL